MKKNKEVEAQRFKLKVDEYDKYCQRIKKIDRGVELIKKVIRLLPNGWTWNVDWFGDVVIGKDLNDNADKVSPIEFHSVVQNVIRILGIKSGDVTRMAEADSNKKTYLKANMSTTFNGHRIAVYVTLGNPSCEVKYEEEFVPGRVRLIPIVPPECLGNKNEVETKDATS